MAISSSISKTATPLSTQWIDLRLASTIRLLLAASALLVLAIDPPQRNSNLQLIYISFTCYTIYSCMILFLSIRRTDLVPVQLMHWLDVGWVLFVVYLTGGSESIFFNYCFFAILVASFGWGYKSGLAVTLGSAALFASIDVLTFHRGGPFQLNQLMLRSIELIVLGFMIARWAGFKISLRNHLHLLREVTVLSNSRFGSDHTINSILEKLRQFFEAETCLLLLKSDNESNDCYRMYCVRHGVDSRGSTPPQISSEAAGLFLSPSYDHSLIYRKNFRNRPPRLIHINTRKSSAGDHTDADRLANALETTSYMSVPVHNRRQPIGRLYIVGGPDTYDNSAVEFVIQLVNHVVPLIENLRLIDSLASYAAEEERRRIARDIHDSVIQPYVGLQLGIAAVAQKLNAGNNDVLKNVEDLLDLTKQELVELRRYVCGLRAGDHRRDMLMPAIERFVSRFSTVTGIDVSIRAKGKIELNDRLASEVFQMITEGLSNIRRHALCNAASVELACNNKKFLVEIKNPRPPNADTDLATSVSVGEDKNLFTPKSISERARLLGGKTKVCIDDKNRTVVQIAIPL